MKRVMFNYSNLVTDNRAKGTKHNYHPLEGLPSKQKVQENRPNRPTAHQPDRLKKV